MRKWKVILIVFGTLAYTPISQCQNYFGSFNRLDFCECLSLENRILNQLFLSQSELEKVEKRCRWIDKELSAYEQMVRWADCYSNQGKVSKVPKTDMDACLSDAIRLEVFDKNLTHKNVDFCNCVVESMRNMGKPYTDTRWSDNDISKSHQIFADCHAYANRSSQDKSSIRLKSCTNHYSSIWPSESDSELKEFCNCLLSKLDLNAVTWEVWQSTFQKDFSSIGVDMDKLFDVEADIQPCYK